MAEETWKDYKKNKAFRPSLQEGIRVLEVYTIIPDPAGPALLAEMGADVIKCEIPPMGYTQRILGPKIQGH